MGTIDSRISFNFSVAKVLAILLVVAGHFFTGVPLWIPVTIGLFVFAYSSAYFTSRKYRSGFSTRSFWASKAWRLGIPFWVTQFSLLMLFLLTGKSGIWTWQTVIHWLGQSGWLNWFALPNPSPFGSGLWFLTLLLLFYLAYPAIDRWNAVGTRAKISVSVAFAVALVLQHSVDVGHMLWVTAFAFWYGAYAGRYSVGGTDWTWLVVGVAIAAVLFGLNAAGLKALNIPLLAGVAIAFVHWLEKVSLPKKYLSWLQWLSPCVLEIYLIHTYLFVDQGWSLPVRFIVSILLIIISAQLLAQLTNRLERILSNAHPAHS